jgi:signal transduction histidine kinase
VSRITQGKVVLQCQLVDLRQIVDAALQTLQSSERLRQHAVAITRASSPIFVSGDPVRLEQIVWNLLSNAIKYTPQGGHVWITASAANGDAWLSVRDDGIGIPVMMLPRVFEPFIQLEHSLDRAEGGLGLGLPLVRNLVLLHGGSIRATSAGKGCGTEFVVRFPLPAPAPRPPAVRAACASSSPRAIEKE